jgi:hypothetical protein
MVLMGLLDFISCAICLKCGKTNSDMINHEEVFNVLSAMINELHAILFQMDASNKVVFDYAGSWFLLRVPPASCVKGPF